MLKLLTFNKKCKKMLEKFTLASGKNTSQRNIAQEFDAGLVLSENSYHCLTAFFTLKKFYSVNMQYVTEKLSLYSGSVTAMMVAEKNLL